MTEVWKFTVLDSIRFAGGFELIGAFDFNNGFFFKKSSSELKHEAEAYNNLWDIAKGY